MASPGRAESDLCHLAGGGGRQGSPEAFLMEHHPRNQVWCTWVPNPFILREKVLNIIRAPLLQAQRQRTQVQPPPSISFQCSSGGAKPSNST